MKGLGFEVTDPFGSREGFFDRIIKFLIASPKKTVIDFSQSEVMAIISVRSFKLVG
jgi:hypothetical protein